MVIFYFPAFLIFNFLIYRISWHCCRSRKKKAYFWKKLHSPKEAKNILTASLGSAAGRDSYNLGNCSHHIFGALILPATWRRQ